MEVTNLLFAAVAVVSFILGRVITRQDALEMYKRGVSDGTYAMLKYLTPYLKDDYLDKTQEGKPVHPQNRL